MSTMLACCNCVEGIRLPAAYRLIDPVSCSLLQVTSLRQELHLGAKGANAFIMTAEVKLPTRWITCRVQSTTVEKHERLQRRQPWQHGNQRGPVGL
jgi:hypothetical protein